MHVSKLSGETAAVNVIVPPSCVQSGLPIVPELSVMLTDSFFSMFKREILEQPSPIT
ncbi:MAG: hypothetical protein AAB267_10540 [Candidatus Desantisbacteria bacterium]